MEKLSKFLNYLIITIFFLYGIFYFFKSRNFAAQVDSSSVKSPEKAVDVDEIVNKFMRQTAAQTIHDQYAAQLALKKQLTQPLKLSPSVSETSSEDVPVEKQILKADSGDSPAEIIRQEVFEKELQLKSEQLDRQEYARQYIENARRSGYHLVLSEDLKVISVTPIRKPSQNIDSVDSFPAD